MNAVDESRRILVADDDPIFLGLFGASLPPTRYDVVSVGDGASAMMLLEKERFDLAVIDIEMPIIDGIRLIALIRATPHLFTLPVTVITSMREARIREECLRTGANDFMSKPVDWAALPARLEAVMAMVTGRQAAMAPPGAEALPPVLSAS